MSEICAVTAAPIRINKAASQGRSGQDQAAEAPRVSQSRVMKS